jgi:anti-sigma B factor antagonist
MAPDETPTDGGSEDPTAIRVGQYLEESPLQILVRHRAEHAYVVLSGELDGATAPFLLRTLVEVNDTLEGDLVLDINQLSFIDSTGLSVFVSQQKQLNSSGKKLVIYAPTPMARRLFQITGLEDVLTIELLGESDKGESAREQ